MSNHYWGESVMNDQAQALRNRILRDKADEVVEKEITKPEKPMKIITITSGKGGVGKSNFSTNVAIALSEYSKSPVILDADFGLANVEIILGERPKYNLGHLIQKKCTLEELVTPTRHGVSFISGGSGVKDMMFLTPSQIDEIGDELGKLEGTTDVLIIDTGAGINDIVLKFSKMADEVYLIVTPEPASMTDAYALVKTLVSDFNIIPDIKVIINKADSKEEAHEVFHKISYVAKQFLKLELTYGGYVPYDAKLFEAVKKQEPVTVYAPKAQSSHAYHAVARNMAKMENLEEKTKLGWKDRFKMIFSK